MRKNYKSCTKKSTRGRKTTKRNTRGKKLKTYENKSKKYVLCLIVLGVILYILYTLAPDCIQFQVMMAEEQENKIREIVQDEIQKQNSSIEEPVVETNEVSKVESQPVTSRGGLTQRPETKVDNSLEGYRITSYYPGDGCLSTNKTGSGLTTSDFSTMKIGNKSVYTYKGKIVVACATQELKKSGYSVKGAQSQQAKHYFKYFDELKINIDGTLYDAICLDSCGAAMWKGEYRIDIYVPSASDVINRSNVTAYYNI